MKQLKLDGLNESALVMHQEAVEKGFWDVGDNLGEKLMLVVSELSEGLEADRKRRYADWTRFDHIAANGEGMDGQILPNVFVQDVKDTLEDELADAVIRIMDLAARRKIDLEKHIITKFAYNQTRPQRHGKAY